MLTTVTFPAKLPVAAGEKLTDSDNFCPGASATAPEKPLMPKPVPDALTCETVTEPVPVLVRVSGSVPVVLVA